MLPGQAVLPAMAPPVRVLPVRSRDCQGVTADADGVSDAIRDAGRQHQCAAPGCRISATVWVCDAHLQLGGGVGVSDAGCCGSKHAKRMACGASAIAASAGASLRTASQGGAACCEAGMVCLEWQQAAARPAGVRPPPLTIWKLHM